MVDFYESPFDDNPYDTATGAARRRSGAPDGPTAAPIGASFRDPQKGDWLAETARSHAQTFGNDLSNSVEFLARGLVGDDEGRQAAAEEYLAEQQKARALGPEIQSFDDAAAAGGGVGNYAKSLAFMGAGLVPDAAATLTGIGLGGTLARRAARKTIQNTIADQIEQSAARRALQQPAGRAAAQAAQEAAQVAPDAVGAVSSATRVAARQAQEDARKAAMAEAAAIAGRTPRLAQAAERAGVWGGRAGGTAAAIPTLNGEANAELAADPNTTQSDMWKLMAGTTAAAATQVFPLERFLGKFGKGALDEVSGGARELLKRTGKESVIQGGMEGGQEVLQQALQNTSHAWVTKNLDDVVGPQAFQEYLVSFLAGGALGAGMGGGGELARGVAAPIGRGIDWIKDKSSAGYQAARGAVRERVAKAAEARRARRRPGEVVPPEGAAGVQEIFSAKLDEQTQNDAIDSDTDLIFDQIEQLFQQHATGEFQPLTQPREAVQKNPLIQHLPPLERVLMGHLGEAITGLPEGVNRARPLIQSAAKLFSNQEITEQDQAHIDTLREMIPNEVRIWEAAGPAFADMTEAASKQAKKDARDAKKYPNPSDGPLGFGSRTGIGRSTEAGDLPSGFQEEEWRDGEPSYVDVERMVMSEPGSDEHESYRERAERFLIGDLSGPDPDDEFMDPAAFKRKYYGGDGRIIKENAKNRAWFEQQMSGPGYIEMRGFDVNDSPRRRAVDLAKIAQLIQARTGAQGDALVATMLGDLSMLDLDLKPETLKPGPLHRRDVNGKVVGDPIATITPAQAASFRKEVVKSLADPDRPRMTPEQRAAKIELDAAEARAGAAQGRFMSRVQGPRAPGWQVESSVPERSDGTMKDDETRDYEQGPRDLPPQAINEFGKKTSSDGAIFDVTVPSPYAEPIRKVRKLKDDLERRALANKKRGAKFMSDDEIRSEVELAMASEGSKIAKTVLNERLSRGQMSAKTHHNAIKALSKASVARRYFVRAARGDFDPPPRVHETKPEGSKVKRSPGNDTFQVMKAPLADLVGRVRQVMARMSVARANELKGRMAKGRVPRAQFDEFKQLLRYLKPDPKYMTQEDVVYALDWVGKAMSQPNVPKVFQTAVRKKLAAIQKHIDDLPNGHPVAEAFNDAAEAVFAGAPHKGATSQRAASASEMKDVKAGRTERAKYKAKSGESRLAKKEAANDNAVARDNIEAVRKADPPAPAPKPRPGKAPNVAGEQRDLPLENTAAGKPNQRPAKPNPTQAPTDADTSAALRAFGKLFKPLKATEVDDDAPTDVTSYDAVEKSFDAQPEFVRDIVFGVFSQQFRSVSEAPGDAAAVEYLKKTVGDAKATAKLIESVKNNRSPAGLMRLGAAIVKNRLGTDNARAVLKAVILRATQLQMLLQHASRPGAPLRSSRAGTHSVAWRKFDVQPASDNVAGMAASLAGGKIGITPRQRGMLKMLAGSSVLRKTAYSNEASEHGPHFDGSRVVIPSLHSAASTELYDVLTRMHPVDVLVHEATHALTVRGEQLDTQARKDLNALVNHVRKHAEAAGMPVDLVYGFTNTQEFLAEAFSNVQFQNYLRKIPALNTKTYKSAWDEFKALVAKIAASFGVKIDGTALEEALTIGMHLGKVTKADMDALEALRELTDMDEKASAVHAMETELGQVNADLFLLRKKHAEDGKLSAEDTAAWKRLNDRRKELVAELSALQEGDDKTQNDDVPQKDDNIPTDDQYVDWDEHAKKETPDTAKETELANEMLRSMGIDEPVKVVEGEPAPRTFGGTYTRGTRVITLNPNLKGQERIETLMHEVGHHVVWATIAKAVGWDVAGKMSIESSLHALKAANPKLYTALKKDFDAFNAKFKAGQSTQREYLAARKPLMRSVRAQNMDGRVLADNFDSTPSAFHEWIADNIAKALTTQKTPRSIVGKFFAEIATAMRSLWNKLSPANRQKYTAAKSVDQWVREMFSAEAMAIREKTGQAAPRAAVEGTTRASVAASVAPVQEYGEPVGPQPPLVINGDTIGDFTHMVRTMLGKTEKQILERVFGRGSMVVQMRASLNEMHKDNPAMRDASLAALDAAEGGMENRIALGYMLWQTGRLRVGPSTKLTLHTLRDDMMALVGLAGDGEYAHTILSDLADGTVKRVNESGRTYDVRKLVASRQGPLQGALDRARAVYEKAGEAIGKVLDSQQQRMLDSGLPSMATLAGILHKPQGATGNDPGIIASVVDKTATFMRKADRALAPLSERQRVKVIQAMQRQLPPDSQKNPDVAKAIVELRAVFDEAYTYMKDESGVDVGERKHFFPIAFDAANERAPKILRDLYLTKEEDGTYRYEKPIREAFEKLRAKETKEASASAGKGRDVPLPDPDPAAMAYFEKMRAKWEKRSTHVAATNEKIIDAITHGSIAEIRHQIELSLKRDNRTTTNPDLADAFDTERRYMNARIKQLQEAGFGEHDGPASGKKAKTKGGNAAPVEEPFEDLVDNLVNGALQEGEAIRKVGEAPRFRGIKHRLSQFIYDHGDPADIKKFASVQSKHAGEIFARYFEPMVKHAEFTRRLGGGETNREKLDTLIGKMREEGATDKDVQFAEDAVAAAVGAYGADGSPTLKMLSPALAERFSGPKTKAAVQGLQAYQNARLLPLSLLSSLVDPMGIGVRTGGDFHATWEGFKTGIQTIFNKAKRDEMLAMLEDLGSTEDMLPAMAAGAGFTDDRAPASRRVNDFVFKYNGMQAWVRATRFMALKAGHLFLIKHAAQAADNDTSRRYLAELGLSASDIVVGTDGKVEMNDKVRNALSQFVNSAVLRPHSQQVPQWYADPYMGLVTQYKGFLYALYEQIGSRIGREINHGNLKVLLPALSYLPVVIMAELLREMLQHGEEGNPQREQWGPTDYTWLGVERSGLMGPKFSMLNEVVNDSQSGRVAGTSLLGPTAGQARNLMLAAEGKRSASGEFENALPANPLYKHRVNPLEGEFNVPNPYSPAVEAIQGAAP